MPSISKDRRQEERQGANSGPDDIVVVPYFWLFKIDACELLSQNSEQGSNTDPHDSDTILTLYPER